VRVDNEKMSKSLGNFFTIREVLQKYDARQPALLPRAHALPQPVQLQRRASGPTPATRSSASTRRSMRCRLLTVTIDWSEATALRLQGCHGRGLRHARRRCRAVRSGHEVNRTRRRKTAGLLKALAGTLGLLQGEPRAYLQGGSTVAMNRPAIEELHCRARRSQGGQGLCRRRSPSAPS
jgi:cysteinyl-tRNA synthetase